MKKKPFFPLCLNVDVRIIDKQLCRYVIIRLRRYVASEPGLTKHGIVLITERVL